MIPVIEDGKALQLQFPRFQMSAMGDNIDNLTASVADSRITNGTMGQGEEAVESTNSDIVTPWTVQTSSAAGVDYTKLIRKISPRRNSSGCRVLKFSLS